MVALACLVGVILLSSDELRQSPTSSSRGEIVVPQSVPHDPHGEKIVRILFGRRGGGEGEGDEVALLRGCIMYTWWCNQSKRVENCWRFLFFSQV